MSLLIRSCLRLERRVLRKCRKTDAFDVKKEISIKNTLYKHIVRMVKSNNKQVPTDLFRPY